MRKIIAVTTLTLVLAGTANAADTRNRDRSNPRDRDTPIVRVYKAIKRFFTPATQNWPTTPVP